MKKIALLFVLLPLLLPTSSEATLPAMVDGEPLPSLAPVLERVTPSVVNIYTQTRVRINNPLINDPFFRRFFNIPDQPQERVSQSLGSGVIVDADEGYVLTNNHVISGADEISVTLSDGRSFRAEVIGTDPDTDLAMVRIPAENLRALAMADSNSLRVGDFVVAVGNPFGLGQTVTSGIVSALGRAGFRGLEFQNFIQTDASINPGNSGGALVNLRGELVGINSAIFTPSGGNIGIGFAIPSAMASYVMQQLAESGEVLRGTLGVYVQDLTPELAGALGIENTKGALVAEVVKGAAADKAGIEAGDVITQVATYPVHGMQDFYIVEGQLPIGEKKSLNYLRKGKERSTRLSASPLPVLQGADLDRRLSGAVFEELPAKMRADQLRGVIISGLDRQSRLARSGFRPGDIVTAVNRQPLQGLSEFEQLVKNARGPMLFQLRRNGEDYVARID
ncbi:MAG TPA: Do family serine endopeptidase [Xanthomonadales bacterium]|nr:Do family serine endopeptidase [Xanthomonadales bacterium]